MLLEGIYLPLTTPFHADGRLYLHKLESNVARYSLTPAAGMLLLGQSGEADSLTDAETRDVLRTAISASLDEKVMIAAVGRQSIAATLELAHIAATAGYDAISLRGPAFAADASMRAALLTYFRVVADRAPLPIVLLSDADRPLALEVVAELAQHPMVLGVVEQNATPDHIAALKQATAEINREVVVTTIFAAATGRMLRHTETTNFVALESLGSTAVAVAPPRTAVKTRTKRVGFQILSGATRHMLNAWEAGAVGAVPNLSAAAPQACCEVWQAFKDGDPALAAEKQHRIYAAAAMAEGWQGIAATKYGCDLNAYYGGPPRLPLLPLDATQRQQIELLLAGLKN